MQHLTIHVSVPDHVTPAAVNDAVRNIMPLFHRRQVASDWQITLAQMTCKCGAQITDRTYLRAEYDVPSAECVDCESRRIETDGE